MRLLTWLLRALLFFILFAFALNNQQSVTVHWFFGLEWQAPLVIVLLVVFAAGCAVGVMAMVPAWWRHRRAARRHAHAAAGSSESATAASDTSDGNVGSVGPNGQPMPPDVVRP